MASSPFDTDSKAAAILPAHTTEFPPQGVNGNDELTTTRRKRFLHSKLGKSVLYLGIFGLLAALLTLILGWLLIPGSIPTVTLRQGKFQGIIINRPDLPKSVEAHLGIPYALPPVGELRFARPRPVLASNETFEASSFGSR
jgi:hypothetical protein